MPLRSAENFADYVDLMATNSPHATIMDWWRRLDLALHTYYDEEVGGMDASREELEKQIGLDGNFGEPGRRLLQRLRQYRNRVAHGSIQISREEAVRFAQESLRFIGALGSERPLAECVLVPVGGGTT